MSRLVRYDPLTYLLRVVRDPLVEGLVPSWKVYGAALAVMLCATAVAVPLLGRLQRKVVLYL
jgi:ABC-type polysaccharide/polyol phosphate export permease